MKPYSIICGSRTGSTYLCNLLKKTNRSGLPDEFFNPDMNFKFSPQLILKHSTQNHVFGVKIVGTKQFELYKQHPFSNKVNKHVWLYRKDKVLQAISRYIAWKTDGWHKDIEYPEYSYNDISWCLTEIEEENIYYNNIFKNLDYIKIQYELDLCLNPEQTIISILNYLDIKTEELPKIPSSRKIVNPINIEWRNRFVKEKNTR